MEAAKNRLQRLGAQLKADVNMVVEKVTDAVHDGASAFAHVEQVRAVPDCGPVLNLGRLVRWTASLSEGKSDA